VLIRRLRDQILAGYLVDNVKARVMQPDGTYTFVPRDPHESAINVQEMLVRGDTRRVDS